MIISFKSTAEIAQELALNLKKKRKWLKHSRAKAAEITGVPAPTIRKFEDTGKISLNQLLMLAQVYGETAYFEHIFDMPKARTMDELIKMQGEDE